ncbi:hypothetical protein HJFPF1_05166 [Paramyrothecium foliicola]|nr:hypothetical protein HJFPF1_05166 [Paramyrothecium foliicola]
MASIRGNGLLKVHAALAALVQDPQLLDRARRRFSESPPYFRSLSGTTTCSPSSSLPDEEQELRDKRRFQLMRDLRASYPSNQFKDQIFEECRCIFKESSRDHSSPPPPPGWLPGPEINICAAKNVKKRWIDQGIWRDEWNDKNPYGVRAPYGAWKHEEPLELESESETNSEAEAESVLTERGKTRRPKGDEEMKRIAERRTVRTPAREASRPYYQFCHQVSKTRERIQDESRVEGDPTDESVDINTKAYEHVKNTWIKRGIWNDKWGILPGMSWKHEHPLEELMADDPILAQTNGLEDHGSGARETRPGTPQIRPSGSPQPVGSGHSEASVARTERSVAINEVDLQNANANGSSPAPRSRRRLTQSRQESSAAGQRPLRGGRETSRGGRPKAHASLGPVNPSKVSKVPRKRAPVPARPPNVSGETSSARMPPRRSKRLQQAKLRTG